MHGLCALFFDVIRLYVDTGFKICSLNEAFHDPCERILREIRVHFLAWMISLHVPDEITCFIK